MMEQEKKLAMARKKKNFRFGGRPNPQPTSERQNLDLAKRILTADQINFYLF
jgi:hypothetical protein